MFEYNLPCGGFHTATIVDAIRGISFYPPVYEQRYIAAMQILEDERWSKHMKKVIDFGCAEMKLLPLLRRIESVEHILAIDIDKDLLEKNKYMANPLVCEFLNRRKDPLRIDILQGSIAEPAIELENTDAVVALELIEHVYDDVLSKIPGNIFGFIQPKLVIISTPNQEFNVIFSMQENTFRHHDHKFEWTRAQFENWCQNITATYTNYKVAFLGVGEPPVGKENVGFVSQIAVFARNDIIDLPLVVEERMETLATDAIESTYNLIHSVDYPVYVDKRTKEQKIVDELQYRIQQITNYDSEYLDDEKNIFKIPIADMVKYTIPLDGCESVVRELLSKISYVTVKDDSLLVAKDGFGIEDDSFDKFEHAGSESEDDEISKFSKLLLGNDNDSDVDVDVASIRDDIVDEEMWD